MPRENSFSDEERSLTPDLDDAEGKKPQTSAHLMPTTTTTTTTGVAAAAHGTLSMARTVSRKTQKSLRSRFSKSHTSIPMHGYPAPKEKFKATVRRIIAMRRGISTFAGLAQHRIVGDEPGVDPRRPLADATYGHLQMPCEIEIVDYSSVRCTSRKMNNAEFVDFMDVESAEPVKREPWVKVRWINIGGMSWDVLKAVSIKYNVHPLALEDVLNGNPHTRSKADYYSRHLFLRVLCHELATDDDPRPDGIQSQALDMTTTSALEDELGEDYDDDISVESKNGDPLAHTNLNNRNMSLLPTHLREARTTRRDRLRKLIMKEKALQAEQHERKVNEISFKAITKGERIEVDVSTMNLFLLRDGTVISIHPTRGLDFTAPIALRLRPLDTVLRKSADPSLLVHAILDLIVDRVLEIVDQYQVNINKYKQSILLRPKMKTVRLLHILSGDLILHKRTLEPLKTMIYGLRRYDVDRCAALIDSSDPKNKDVQVVGFMSHKAKIYLADVFDHMEYILASLDMFAGVSENLINYTFNISSHEMNEVMRRLTVVTIIMLPLTVLTGYFGMNFSRMWSVQDNSDLFFWILAIPIFAFVLTAALWSDIKKLWHYVRRRAAIKKMIGGVFLPRRT